MTLARKRSLNTVSNSDRLPTDSGSSRGIRMYTMGEPSPPANSTNVSKMLGGITAALPVSTSVPLAGPADCASTGVGFATKMESNPKQIMCFISIPRSRLISNLFPSRS